MNVDKKKKEEEKLIVKKFFESNFNDFEITNDMRESPDFEVKINNNVYGVELLRFFDEDIASTEGKMIRVLDKVLKKYDESMKDENINKKIRVKVYFVNKFEKRYDINDIESIVDKFIYLLNLGLRIKKDNYTLKTITNSKRIRKKFNILRKYFRKISVKISSEYKTNHILASYKYRLEPKIHILKNKINKKITIGVNYDKNFFENWLLISINYNVIKIKNKNIKLSSFTGANQLEMIKNKIKELDLNLERNIFDKIIIFNYRDGKYIDILENYYVSK